MAGDLRKIRETDREIQFAHASSGGWIGALAGAVLVGWALTGLEGGPQLLAGALGALLLLSGISGTLYRLELTLDLERRRYRYRRGHLPSPEEGEGGFDDFEAVVLKKELERRGSERVDEWEVELVVRGWPRPLEVLETKDGAEARREAERLAGRLGVEVRERTGY